MTDSRPSPAARAPRVPEFTDADLVQLRQQGIAPEDAAEQLRLLREPPRPVVLDRPCMVGDGIVRIDASEHAELLALAHTAAADGRVEKFVPASGAATRMFNDLALALAGDARPSSVPQARTFFERLDDFPFARLLRKRTGIMGPLDSEADERQLLRTLLEEMQYSVWPKALIPFHRAGSLLRTPFEEHLLESVQYTRSRDGLARTHFTTPPEFRDEFERLLVEVTPRVSAIAPGVRLEVSFSEQHPATDTLAVTPEGEPFRTADGALLLRPAGHGALLRNLHALRGEIVVIKNIDNVVPSERSAEVVFWKRLLIGLLVRVRAGVTDDRPLRVCGVVKNEGEPGGAPFWVVDGTGQRSLQIVESSQVNLADPDQRRIFESATHFNPVDIVCALQNQAGQPFDLDRFIDPSAVLRSEKSHEGRPLIALERPGLWNGAMARWHTVFVEVPGSTFAPVKTVLDLLRPEHQSS